MSQEEKKATSETSDVSQETSAKSKPNADTPKPEAIKAKLTEKAADLQGKAAAKKENPEAMAKEREKISRYHEILLTSSSILAGFSLNGLLGLPEVGAQGISQLSKALNLPYSDIVFPVVYIAMLFATICFLGVLIGIVSFRLQSIEPSITFLRFSFRASVIVFGMGIGSLFTATVTMGVPTYNGFFVGLGGGTLIVFMMFYRAFFLQSDTAQQ